MENVHYNYAILGDHSLVVVAFFLPHVRYLGISVALLAVAIRLFHSRTLTGDPMYIFLLPSFIDYEISRAVLMTRLIKPVTKIITKK
jgi:hypothetical protein